MVEQSCRLLGGIFSILVQFSLAAICVLTLVYKRQTEVPRRDWLVWFLDATKQGVGSSFGHFSNMIVSVIIADSIVGADECQWYCLTYVIDCTFGTVLNLTFLSLFEKLVQHYQFATEYLNFGEYGDPPSMKIYFLQLGIWLMFVILGKCIILFVLIQVINPLDQAISVIFSVFQNHPDAELLTVMIVIPTILNSIQFWVTDTFLKKQEEPLSPMSASHRLMGGTGSGGRSGSKYKHSHLSLSDSDTDLDEDLMSNSCNLGGSPTVSTGYKSLNISKSKHTESNQRLPASNNRKNSTDSRKGATGGSSSNGGGSGTAYNQYISDPTKILSDSTKQYVIPSASYVAKMYKKGTANMPNLWSYVFGETASTNGSASGSGTGSRHNSSDNINSGDDDSDGSSPVAHNPLIQGSTTKNTVGGSGSSSSSSGGGGSGIKPPGVPTAVAAAAYKKNDSFNSTKDLLPEGNAKGAPGSGIKSGSRGSPAPVASSGSAAGQLKQRKDFVGDVESNSYI